MSSLLIILTLVFLSPLSGADEGPRLTACEEVLDEERNHKQKEKERKFLADLSLAHNAMQSEAVLQRAASVQRDLLESFQKLREGICKQKRNTGIATQASSYAETRAALGAGVNNCGWFEEQVKRLEQGKETANQHKELLQKKKKEWRKGLLKSRDFNRNVVAQLQKSRRIPPNGMTALKTEYRQLWEGGPNQEGKKVDGFFPSLEEFFRREEKWASDVQNAADADIDLMMNENQECASLIAVDRVDPKLKKIAEEEAMKCRTPAKFIQERTGLTEICGNRSKGKCYEATNATLIRAGYVRPGELAGVGAIQAHRDGHLERAGFRNVIDRGYTPTNAPEGAVLVYSSTHHPYGHIEVRTNKRNCSDYCANGSPGPNYRLEAVYVRTKR